MVSGFLRTLTALVIFTMVISVHSNLTFAVPDNSYQVEDNTYENYDQDEMVDEESEQDEGYTEEDIQELVDSGVEVETWADSYSEVKPDIIPREQFESDEEYDEYLQLIGEDGIRTRSWVKIAQLTIKRISDKLHVKQSLKTDYKFIPIRNQHLAGKKHSVTGIPFDNNGFPLFKSKANFTIPDSLLKSSNTAQFNNLNAQLKLKTQLDVNFKYSFNATQRAEIANGLTPTGYVWHHHQKTGYFQLVDKTIHEKTGHTGGKSIWGSL
ncbi:HNH endonuclease [Neobacillus kokaensis]|uniref:HNH endonuclease n=1 Tax=Neobacillus kokaensis TaxID=2759023 RepID=A0ABQ3N880_9BACI|nr:HNH endonuclease [Neobacillus kokaensis]GHI00066.1 hypothetical protein AM1BK_36080 [Neobacillus kokaensis]